jgi:YHS domain-containing protein
MKRLPVVLTAFAMLIGISFAAEINLEGVKCAMNPKAPAKADKVVDYKGGKVYFCCNNCPKGFAAKIEAKDEVTAAKGNKQLVQTGQAKQEKCPFSGGPLKEKLTVAGAEIQFCCNNCKGKAEKLEGDEQLVALFGDKAYEKAGFKVKKEEKSE